MTSWEWMAPSSHILRFSRLLGMLRASRIRWAIVALLENDFARTKFLGKVGQFSNTSLRAKRRLLTGLFKRWLTWQKQTQNPNSTRRESHHRTLLIWRSALWSVENFRFPCRRQTLRHLSFSSRILATCYVNTRGLSEKRSLHP